MEKEKQIVVIDKKDNQKANENVKNDKRFVQHKKIESSWRKSGHSFTQHEVDRLLRMINSHVNPNWGPPVMSFSTLKTYITGWLSEAFTWAPKDIYEKVHSRWSQIDKPDSAPKFSATLQNALDSKSNNPRKNRFNSNNSTRNNSNNYSHSTIINNNINNTNPNNNNDRGENYYNRFKHRPVIKPPQIMTDFIDPTKFVT